MSISTMTAAAYRRRVGPPVTVVVAPGAPAPVAPPPSADDDASDVPAGAPGPGPGSAPPDSVGAVLAIPAPPLPAFPGFTVAPGSIPTQQQGVSSALETITAYIPSEILVLYVAVVAALDDQGAARTDPTGASQWVAFAAFLILTPLVVWLAFAGRLRGDGFPLPVRLHHWPRWEMSASTVAFVAWALAMPATPFARVPGYNSGVAGVVVLAVTVMLGLVSPLVTSPTGG